MKKIILLILFSLMLKSVDAQKMFIWCPSQINISPRSEQFKNNEINILINDNRILPDNVKNKCTSEDLKNILFSFLNTTYPSSIITRTYNDKLKKDENKIFLELNITAYYSKFAAPYWLCQTNYSVKITDMRNGTKKEFSHHIEKEIKFMNLNGGFGYGVVEKNLNLSYIDANVELLEFLTESLSD